MVTSVLALLLGLVVVLAITAATGYFVAQEFAYMAVDRSTLRARAEAGDAAAARALEVTGRTSFMLSGAQLGITVTGLVVGYVAEPLIGESVGTLLGGISVPSGVGIAVGTVVALVLSTVVQMVFGELFPKNLAISRPEPVARRLSRSTLVYLAVAGWLVKVFDASSNALLRLLRIEPVHDVEHAASARDLRRIVTDAGSAGGLTEDLSVLLDRTLDTSTRPVRHAMVPRRRTDTVDAGARVAEVAPTMRHGHSRYPVVDDTDRVLGVLHLVDVLGADPDARAGDLARPACVVPEAMTLPAASRTLRGRRAQLAVVLDEHGSFAGILTHEDIAEEVVGELTDEHDDAPPPGVSAHDDGTWTAAGDLGLDELARALDVRLPEVEAETVAGLAIAAHDGFPAVGDTVRLALPTQPADLLLDPTPVRHLEIDVLATDPHVPTRVRVRVTTAAGLITEARV
ncbi:hemolysin family protein [Jatrophihabitans sp. YIM 134969]